MGTITLEQVTKVYPGGTVAVHELDLEIADGEFMVLVGPSGCGKTTVLRMVAGLEEITSGTVRINDRVVNDLSPSERDIAMVFQNYALYPHMTVAENIAFALSLRKVPKRERQQKVNEVAQILGLTEFLRRKPAQLSGGQRQRVAMGRAIVRRPAAFLMDEPLSNLDAKLRVQMRAEIMRLQRRMGVSTMYVTHDQTEAMTMGDRVAVLRDGYLQQVAPPQVLYDEPANTFVAGFIGSPPMNMYLGTLERDGASVRLGTQPLPLPPALRDSPLIELYHGRPVIVGIRPEHLRDAALVPEGDQRRAVLRGDVEMIESLGSEKLVHFRIDAERHHINELLDPSDPSAGTELRSTGELGAAMTSDGVARVASASQIHQGEPAAFSVEIDRIYLFDAESGEALTAESSTSSRPVSSVPHTPDSRRAAAT